ncbi:(2Fe-2S)-binding protein [Arsenicibacter rosenii]|uniref:(2Fe-2S)-binding protein n=2 Tax=Arsenicibacter rosenii TaxID=1750698 RepID=A0A1S2VC49_9BACT|nr:(2Fe-2S)-binding protein [Arsenicibacter rosenii]
MTRVEFLKSMGFKGAALMALLTSCVREEDTYVDAITIGGTTTPTSTSTSSSTTSSPVSTTTSSTTSSSGTTNGVDPTTITSYKLKIDLTASSSANLKKVGGYIVSGGIVVALSSAGVYVAATQTCTHEPKKQVIYSSGEFYCTAHGARFSLTGQGLNSLGSKGLTVYKTASNGSILVVY